MSAPNLINTLFACGLYALWIIGIAAGLSVFLARIAFRERRPKLSDYFANRSGGVEATARNFGRDKLGRTAASGTNGVIQNVNSTSTSTSLQTGDKSASQGGL